MAFIPLLAIVNSVLLTLIGMVLGPPTLAEDVIEATVEKECNTIEILRPLFYHARPCLGSVSKSASRAPLPWQKGSRTCSLE